MTKTTITEQINAIAFDTLTEEQFNFLVDRALKSIRKHSNGERKPTKTQRENEGIKSAILEYLAEYPEGLTAKAVYEGVGLSSVQKASALLNQLVATHEVTKNTDGNATLFAVAE